MANIQVDQANKGILTQPPEPPVTLVVDINEEDILLGRRRSSRECPIARALVRTLFLAGYELDGAWPVCVGGNYPGTATVGIQFAHRDVLYGYDAGDFVERFDAGQYVRPRAVTLTRMVPERRNW